MSYRVTPSPPVLPMQYNNSWYGPGAAVNPYNLPVIHCQVVWLAFDACTWPSQHSCVVFSLVDSPLVNSSRVPQSGYSAGAPSSPSTFHIKVLRRSFVEAIPTTRVLSKQAPISVRLTDHAATEEGWCNSEDQVAQRLLVRRCICKFLRRLN
jgi:hypothetical protein